MRSGPIGLLERFAVIQRDFGRVVPLVEERLNRVLGRILPQAAFLKPDAASLSYGRSEHPEVVFVYLSVGVDWVRVVLVVFAPEAINLLEVLGTEAAVLVGREIARLVGVQRRDLHDATNRCFEVVRLGVAAGREPDTRVQYRVFSINMIAETRHHFKHVDSE